MYFTLLVLLVSILGNHYPIAVVNISSPYICISKCPDTTRFNIVLCRFNYDTDFDFFTDIFNSTIVSANRIKRLFQHSLPIYRKLLLRFLKGLHTAVQLGKQFLNTSNNPLLLVEGRNQNFQILYNILCNCFKSCSGSFLLELCLKVTEEGKYIL